MRKRFVGLGKRITGILILAIACLVFAYQAPEIVKKIPKVEPIITPPASAVPADAVPEPATMALVGLGGAALAYRRARKKPIDR